ncbi:MAG: THUMP domain-containing protein [Balneolales bacterium]
MKLFVKTLQGFEELVKKELEQFGGTDVVIQKRGVSFEGDEETLYRTLINSTLALRVLLPIASAKVANEEELYLFVKSAVNWHDHIGLKNTFAFDCVTFHETMNHQVFLAQKSKDAIVDQFRDVFDIRPNVDPKNPDVLINLHISREGEVHLALDASGRSLNQRGYRAHGGDAPLNEVLAAGLIKLSGWEPETPFIDPMCGSGTLLIEAAFMAKNKPPGLVNEKFGVQNWSWFRKGLWTMMVDEAKSRLRKDVDWIEGSDISPKQVDIAKTNLRKARLTKNVRIRLKPFDSMWIPDRKGTIIINLPYGERIGDKTNLARMYPELGRVLKFKARGYKVCIFTGDPEFKDLFPFEPDNITSLMNGTIPCEFIEYKIKSEDDPPPKRSTSARGQYKKSPVRSTGDKPFKGRSGNKTFTERKSGRKPARGEGFTVKQSGGGDFVTKRTPSDKPKRGRPGQKQSSEKLYGERGSRTDTQNEGPKTRKYSRNKSSGSGSGERDKKKSFKGKSRGTGFGMDKRVNKRSKSDYVSDKDSSALKPVDEGTGYNKKTNRKPRIQVNKKNQDKKD